MVYVVPKMVYGASREVYGLSRDANGASIIDYGFLKVVYEF